MTTTYGITDHRTGEVIFRAKGAGNLKEAVLLAAQEHADLRYANLTGLAVNKCDLRGLRSLARADLRGASIYGANLTNANVESSDFTDASLEGANLTGLYVPGAVFHRTAGIVDAGYDVRGFRFWAWRGKKDGYSTVIYRAGCREWESIGAARQHYRKDRYTSDGDTRECLAKLASLYHSAVVGLPA